jgi:hypothetical protein
MNAQRFDPKNARQSAIFWAVGHFYDWDIIKLASLFRVPIGVFELELRQLGFPGEIISSLKNKYEDDSSYCRTCHLESDNEFCSEECLEKEKKIQQLLSRGLLPITYSKYLLYDRNNHKVVRLNGHKSRRFKQRIALRG